MATFTNENSALGDLNNTNNSAIVGLGAPVSVGVILATITYLICRDTGAHSICIAIGLLAGMVVMSLCFVSEKERQMLIENDEACVSQQDPALVKTGNGLWLKLQCLFLVSAVPVFLGLMFLETRFSNCILRQKGRTLPDVFVVISRVCCVDSIFNFLFDRQFAAIKIFVS